MKKHVFIVTKHELIDNTEYDIAVVGVFTRYNLAHEASLEAPQNPKTTFYTIYKYELNKISPIFFVHEDTVELLCKEGIMEPLIDENGEFSFRLTPVGKTIAEKIQRKQEEQEKEEDGE